MIGLFFSLLVRNDVLLFGYILLINVCFVVFVICYFWDEFKIYVMDVYYCYVMNDVLFVVEIVENNVEKEGFDVMKLVEVDKKMVEF